MSELTEKGPCVVIGKCAGSIYRKLSEKANKARVAMGKITKSMSEKTTAVTSRIGNLFKRVKSDSQSAHLEMKQKDNFTKLGQEIFTLTENNQSDIFNHANIKEIMDQLKEDQAKIQDIKAASFAQKKRMEEMVILERAKEKLKNPESSVRRVAIRVLERLGKREAIPYLVKLLEDPDPAIQKRVREVIQKLTTQNTQSETNKQEN